MKHQVLFSLKNNEKIFMKVVCCSRDWGCKGSLLMHTPGSGNHLGLLFFFHCTTECNTDILERPGRLRNTNAAYALTLKAPVMTAADDIHKYFVIVL